mmetsp:Transcript_2340/g.4644  ORF Transcript_2340/g.4644 Transcript_2340/m.4644 type:complete len:543 (-) Transcript_2340:315-1943(-)
MRRLDLVHVRVLDRALWHKVLGLKVGLVLLVHLAHLERQVGLGPLHKLVVEGPRRVSNLDSKRGARHTVLRLPPVQKRLHRHVPLVNHNLVPHSKAVLGKRHNLLLLLVLRVVDRVRLALDRPRNILGRRLRVNLHQHRHRKVALQVLERCLAALLQQLDQLQAHKPSHKRRRRRKRRDDPPRNQLGLQKINLLNRVVARTKIRKRRDKVHVEVAVVVLLKRQRAHLQPPKRPKRRKLPQIRLGLIHNAPLIHLHRLPLPLRLLLPSVNLGILRRHKLLDSNLAQHPLDHVGVTQRLVPRNVVHLRTQVGRAHDEAHMHRILRIKHKRRREPLRRRPEGRTARVLHVLGARKHKLLDLVAKVLLKLDTRPRNTLLHRPHPPLALQQTLKHSTKHLVRLLGRPHPVGQNLPPRSPDLATHLRHKPFPLLKVLRCLPSLRLKHPNKLAPPKRQAVVDVVRKVVKRTLRRLLGLRVLAPTIVDRPVRDHALHIALGPHRPALKQRLAKKHTPRVNILPRLDIVKRIHDPVKPLPKSIVVHTLSRR